MPASLRLERLRYDVISAIPMTPDHWRAIEALYYAALELTGEPRSELLRQADPKVRSAVEAMLGNEASAVLDRPAWEQADASIEAPLELAAGIKLGPYEVVSIIGSGGMGKVYRAKDTRLNREVAIQSVGRTVQPAF